MTDRETEPTRRRLLRSLGGATVAGITGGLAGCTGNGDGDEDGASGDGGNGGDSSGSSTPTLPLTPTESTETPDVSGELVHNGVEAVQMRDHRPVLKTGGIGVTMTVENVSDESVQLVGIDEPATGASSAAHVGIRWLTGGGNVVNTTAYVNFSPAELQPGTAESYPAVGESPRGEASRYELCMVSEPLPPGRDWPEACS